MATIDVQKDPPPDKLEELGVRSWPIWEKEASTFPWHYDEAETCLLLEGDVVVQPTDGSGRAQGPAVAFGAGDLVTFPAGMSCTWTIRKAVRKHYRFG
jgi:uncharacterized protein